MTSKIQQVEKESRELEILDSQILTCGDCGSRLVEIVRTEDNAGRIKRGLKLSNSKFKVEQCYKCGGSSFETPVLSGTVSIGVFGDDYEFDVSDTKIEDIKDIKTGEFTVYTKLITRRRNG